MTVRLSTGLVNKMLDGGASGGLKVAGSWFMNIYSGSQPADANTGAGSATILGLVTKDDDGVTALTFDAAAAGISSKAAAQVWRFHGLTTGTAGWFRLWVTGDTAASDSTTHPRLDGSIGTSGADLNISNTAIVTSAVTTVDAFTVTLPRA